MNEDQHRRLFLVGGICGIVGTICYIIAITVPMGLALSYGVIMAWPILSIVFAFALCRCIAFEKDGPVNQLAFVMACIAFALVAAMVSVQLAVEAGFEEVAKDFSLDNQDTMKLVRRTVRLVDCGLDVAWDCFIGVSLGLLSIAMGKHTRFGLWWSVPGGILGSLLIVLNVLTFPNPPNTRGLFDIGPAVGVYIIALSIRLFNVGTGMKSRKSDH